MEIMNRTLIHICLLVEQPRYYRVTSYKLTFIIRRFPNPYFINLEFWEHVILGNMIYNIFKIFFFRMQLHYFDI